MFVDEIKVHARAGHGGKGCVAFLREPYKPKGGPSGGNGGRGGDVILKASHDLNNLVDQHFQPHLRAGRGQHGQGKGMDGRAGEHLIVKVPCGTLVWKLPGKQDPEQNDATEVDSGAATISTSDSGRPVFRYSGNERALEIDLEEEQVPVAYDERKGELIADLTKDGQEFVLCKGGRGGLGNKNFATPRRQAPRFAQPGEPGEEGDYLLELRIIADIAVVGFPNAGKSTLLSAISKAKPKIAAYPFTTLHPNVGVVEFEDFFRFTVCDVPGLIEGAHDNVGLGHAFLRHIQRCQALVVLVDMAGTDQRAPWDDYQQLIKEIELYDDTLLSRPRLVVANKMDEPAAAENLKKFKRRNRGTKVIPIAAAFDEGLDALKTAMRQIVEKTGSDAGDPRGSGNIA